MRALVRRSEQAPGPFERNPNFGVPRLLPPPEKSEGRLTWVATSRQTAVENRGFAPGLKRS